MTSSGRASAERPIVFARAFSFNRRVDDIHALYRRLLNMNSGELHVFATSSRSVRCR
jgi:hypothetical protein